MTVSILYLRALLELVEDVGGEKDELLAGFDQQRLADASERLTLDEWNALQERALTVTGDEALGLHLGEMANQTTYSLSAHLVAHATTMREGIETLLKFRHLLSDRPTWGFREEGSRALLFYEPQPGPERVRRLGAELTLTAFFRMLRHFSRDATPFEVAFDYPPPPYRDEYARVFEGLERFERGFAAVVFDSTLLGLPHLNSDPAFHSALQATAERQAARLEREAAYARRVRDHLVTQTDPSACTMDGVARALGLSARSLRRRLSEEGVSYKAVVDDARADVAKRLIGEDRSIQEVTYTLGFSDPSAFHHAFKRWTGMTPREFRLRSRK